MVWYGKGGMLWYGKIWFSMVQYSITQAKCYLVIALTMQKVQQMLEIARW